MQVPTRSPHSYILKRLLKLGLAPELARTAAQTVKVQSFTSGHVVGPKGGEVLHWQYIIEGLVAESIPTSNSASTPISIYGKGAWFGEQPIINRKPSYAQYVCLVPTEVLMLPAATFNELFLQDANFARYVAKLMAWRVQKTSETLMLMKLGNPCLRVVVGLAQFAEALAYRSSRPPTIGLGEGVQIPIAQGTLASLCGVSRTLFSEYVGQLAAQGLLKVSYGKLEILESHIWHVFAHRQRENAINQPNPSWEDVLADLRACADGVVGSSSHPAVLSI